MQHLISRLYQTVVTRMHMHYANGNYFVHGMKTRYYTLLRLLIDGTHKPPGLRMKLGVAIHFIQLIHKNYMPHRV